jgi:replicative DNA helicase
MTISLEKIFFAYIIHNKRFLPVVESYFFKNREIEFVYNIIRDYMLSSSTTELPSNKQILEMVNLEDLNGMITRELLKGMLSVNLGDYDQINFIVPRLNAWILSNRIKAGTVEVVDATRDIDNLTDFDDVIISANKIKEIVNNMSNTNFIDDDDLGSDFDDPESHFQDNAAVKIDTGFSTINHVMGSGWDRSTLNVMMGETNSGKSLWMQNFAVGSADAGYNVLYITLEMTERKVMKRLGSMRLKIPINEFDTISKDTDFMRKKIESHKKVKNAGIGEGLFSKEKGKIITKFWAAGTATISDFDAYIARLQDKRNIKIDLIIVDYISLIAVPKSIGGDSLYIKGKLLAEGLRSLASKYNAGVVTAVQLAKGAWNSSDITLESVPESKAIPETADSVWAIIRTDDMKRQNIYRLKLLKQRDGDFSKSQIMFNLNTQYLTLEDDRFIEGLN